MSEMNAKKIANMVEEICDLFETNHVSRSDGLHTVALLVGVILSEKKGMSREMELQNFINLARYAAEKHRKIASH